MCPELFIEKLPDFNACRSGAGLLVLLFRSFPLLLPLSNFVRMVVVSLLQTKSHEGKVRTKNRQKNEREKRMNAEKRVVLS